MYWAIRTTLYRAFRLRALSGGDAADQDALNCAAVELLLLLHQGGAVIGPVETHQRRTILLSEFHKNKNSEPLKVIIF
jgi:hypothetical protein